MDSDRLCLLGDRLSVGDRDSVWVGLRLRLSVGLRLLLAEGELLWLRVGKERLAVSEGEGVRVVD